MPASGSRGHRRAGAWARRARRRRASAAGCDRRGRRRPGGVKVGWSGRGPGTAVRRSAAPGWRPGRRSAPRSPARRLPVRLGSARPGGVGVARRRSSVVIDRSYQPTDCRSLASHLPLTWVIVTSNRAVEASVFDPRVRHLVALAETSTRSCRRWSPRTPAVTWPCRSNLPLGHLLQQRRLVRAGPGRLQRRPVAPAPGGVVGVEGLARVGQQVDHLLRGRQSTAACSAAVDANLRAGRRAGGGAAPATAQRPPRPPADRDSSQDGREDPAAARAAARRRFGHGSLHRVQDALEMQVARARRSGSCVVSAVRRSAARSRTGRPERGAAVGGAHSDSVCCGHARIGPVAAGGADRIAARGVLRAADVRPRCWPARRSAPRCSGPRAGVRRRAGPACRRSPDAAGWNRGAAVLGGRRRLLTTKPS